MLQQGSARIQRDSARPIQRGVPHEVKSADVVDAVEQASERIEIRGRRYALPVDPVADIGIVNNLKPSGAPVSSLTFIDCPSRLCQSDQHVRAASHSSRTEQKAFDRSLRR